MGDIIPNLDPSLVQKNWSSRQQLGKATFGFLSLNT